MDRLIVTLTEGEVLLQGLLRGGAALAHDCGGKLACATCCVVVREGREGLSQPTDDELDMLDRAHALGDLNAAPANRLKPLKGDRKGQHSIHLNDRWRICFVWTPRGPANVEIVDYH